MVPKTTWNTHGGDSLLWSVTGLPGLWFSVGAFPPAAKMIWPITRPCHRCDAQNRDDAPQAWGERFGGPVALGDRWVTGGLPRAV